MPISAALLPEFDQEMANTRKVLARCPEDKFGWKPHPKSFAMGQLANHLANITGWRADVLTSDSFDIAPPGGEQYKSDEMTKQTDLVDNFDRKVAAMRSALAAATDQQLMTPWSLLKGGTPIFTMPRVAVIRGMILNHSIHHRAQLTVYLRLNDVPVPGIYGPSADEQ